MYVNMHIHIHIYKKILCVLILLLSREGSGSLAHGVKAWDIGLRAASKIPTFQCKSAARVCRSCSASGP